MEEEQINQISKILTEWNPLGEDSKNIPDLDHYRTEAIDILCQIEIQKKNLDIMKITKCIIEEAFTISIAKKECIIPAQKIREVVNK